MSGWSTQTCDRFPSQFSGGQRQLLLLLVLATSPKRPDEPLHLSRAGIINFLEDLQVQLKIYLCCHDLAGLFVIYF